MPDGLGEGDSLGEVEGLGDGLGDGLGEGLGDGLGEGEWLGDGEDEGFGEIDADGLMLGRGEMEGDALADGDGLTTEAGDEEAEGDPDGEPEGLTADPAVGDDGDDANGSSMNDTPDLPSEGVSSPPPRRARAAAPMRAVPATFTHVASRCRPHATTNGPITIAARPNQVSVERSRMLPIGRQV